MSLTRESMAAAVRGAAQDAGLSGRELARRTGIAPTTLNRRLAGHGRSFLIPELFAISQCVGVGIVELASRGGAAD